jgi:lipopolysaccharide transport system ATP-binding protein
MSEVAVRVEGLGKRYRIGRRARRRSLGETVASAFSAPLRPLRSRRRRPDAPDREPPDQIWALKDVSFGVEHGEVLGIIGRNGAGKSTLLKVLSRITEPTEGRAEIYGRVGSLLEVGTGFHPELTGRENIYLNGAILGMRRAEIDRKFDEIVAFSEVETFLDTPTKRYSSGMYMRLAFAVAAHLEPEILIVDEVLAVGDMAFQRKCLGKMGAVAREGRTVLFVTHNMQAVGQLCQRAVVLEGGRTALVGPASEAVAHYFGGGVGQAAEVHLADVERATPPEGARLCAVRFADGAGRPRRQLGPGDRLRATVGFAVAKELRSFDLAMAVVHGDGVPVFSETLSDQERPGPLGPGTYEVELTLELKYLKPAPYFLTLYLIDDGRALDNVDGIPLPELHDPLADALKEARRWGTVRIPVAWSELRRSDPQGVVPVPSAETPGPGR